MISQEWHDALRNAIAVMECTPELEPTSALKQCAHDAGIEWGSQMQSFITWAYQELNF